MRTRRTRPTPAWSGRNSLAGCPLHRQTPSEFAKITTTTTTTAPDPEARDPWPERDLALAAVPAGTAARAGKICALAVGDVILDAMSTAVLDHHVRRWFTRAGVPLPPGAAAHAFRHTVAMQLIGLGESVTVVQDLLGQPRSVPPRFTPKPPDGTSAPPSGAHQVVRDLTKP